jgi:ribosomal protein S21
MVNVRIVIDGRGLDAALRALKKALDRDGVTEELKKRRRFVPPSAARKQKQKRQRLRERKRALLLAERRPQEPPQGRRLTRAIRKGVGRAKR